MQRHVFPLAPGDLVAFKPGSAFYENGVRLGTVVSVDQPLEDILDWATNSLGVEYEPGVDYPSKAADDQWLAVRVAPCRGLPAGSLFAVCPDDVELVGRSERN